MNPQQPYGAPAPGSMPPAGQFDFIVNAKPKGSNWLLAAPLKTRIFVVVGGFIALLLVAWIVIALLSGGTSSPDRLVSVAQQQIELTRVAKSAADNLQSPSIKNLASNIKLSMMSDDQALLAYITATGSKPDDKVLALGKNAATDQLLASAVTSGTYDQTYLSIAKNQLNTYALELKQAFNTASSTKERTLLSNAYSHAQLLIDQSNQAGN